MKIVLQRVKKALVYADGREIAAIKKGLLLFVGVGKGDTAETARKLALKIIKLRVFEDNEGKMNLDVKQSGGEILSVSQFTLLGDTSKGNRPGFDPAEKGEKAKELWKNFNKSLTIEGVTVKEGEFGAHMQVELVNDGPVTFVVEGG